MRHWGSIDVEEAATLCLGSSHFVLRPGIDEL